MHNIFFELCCNLMVQVFSFYRYQKSRISSITLLNFRRLLLSQAQPAINCFPGRCLYLGGKTDVLSKALKFIAVVPEKQMAFTKFSSSSENTNMSKRFRSPMLMARSSPLDEKLDISCPPPTAFLFRPVSPDIGT